MRPASIWLTLRTYMPINAANSVEPHPILTDYYADGHGKRLWLKTIFDDTAEDYDRVERWLALGSGREATGTVQ